MYSAGVVEMIGLCRFVYKSIIQARRSIPLSA
nr:MAG TPA: helix-turn-helix domain protein [Bacteriophage sp.]